MGFDLKIASRTENSCIFQASLEQLAQIEFRRAQPEATGVGAFLLTDFKDNLDRLFAPDGEVAVWRSIDDCLKVIGRMIGDDNGRAVVARAGHARTMAQHTYRHRAAEILGFVDARAKR